MRRGRSLGREGRWLGDTSAGGPACPARDETCPSRRHNAPLSAHRVRVQVAVMTALAAADVDAAIRVRGGLPRLRARAAEAARGAALGARVVYVGGSVTAQRDGWRPVFHSWLCRAIPAPLGHEACVAAMGNCGSKVLAFTAHEWVRTPALTRERGKLMRSVFRCSRRTSGRQTWSFWRRQSTMATAWLRRGTQLACAVRWKALCAVS